MSFPVSNFTRLSEEYTVVERAISYIEAKVNQQPSLKEIAASVHLSEYHFQRLFTHWVGISPKRFLQYLTKEGAKGLLVKSENLLDVTYQMGLSSPGRLHDLFITCEGVTPGEYKSKGAGLTIHYGIHPSPFGDCLIGVTDKGICSLQFMQSGEYAEARKMLQLEWLNAELIEDPAKTLPFVPLIFQVHRQGDHQPLPVYLRGTNFQIKVWEALLNIPAGSLMTYEDLSTWINKPGAARAVGNALAQNPIAVLIPCHRVIRKSGDFGNYRYGPARKKALVGWEAAKMESLTA